MPVLCELAASHDCPTLYPAGVVRIPHALAGSAKGVDPAVQLHPGCTELLSAMA